MSILRFVAVLLLTVATLGPMASGQDSSEEDFRKYGEAMQGHWLGDITLWKDIPGVGKAGDRLQVRWTLELTADGKAIVGTGTDGAGSCHALYHFDVLHKQIKGTSVFNGGTVVTSVVVRRDDCTWTRWNTDVNPDGSITKSEDSLIISDDGNTHTWTREGKPNVWRRARRVVVGDNVELHYIECGKGVPVIFIHGSLGDYTLWNKQLSEFGKDYRAISYSRRYAYPNRNRLRANHSAAVEAKDLAGFIQKLDLGQVHIVGYSYGAYTGLILAVNHPELVRTLTLAEPPVLSWLKDMSDEARSIVADGEARIWQPARLAFRKNDPDGAVRCFVDYLFGAGTYNGLPPAVLDRVRRNAQGFEALVMSDDRYPKVDQDAVGKLSMPVLLLYGENTHRTAQLVGSKLRELIPDDRQSWVPIEGANHGLWHQKPNECRDEVLKFLERHGAN